MDDRLDEISRKRLDYYRKYVGHFVTVTKQDGYVVAGILKDITPDHHLFIKGIHKESLFHFLEVKEFSARPDKYDRGDAYR